MTSGATDSLAQPPSQPAAASPSTPTDATHITVTGAHLHNLRDVSVTIPRNRLVAVTGVSGSGKSSLAFGTIHTEAQRRYLETVAPFARRLIRGALDPQVRSITGLPPAVALGQQATSSGTSSRSTVATVSQTGSIVRMLYSRCGTYPEGAETLYSDAFSTNTATGACPACSGLGVVHEPTESSMVPDPDLSIAEGAIAAWPGAWQGKNYRDITATLGYDVTVPWRTLPQESRDWILFTDEQPVVQVVPERDPERIQRPYSGQFSSARRYLMRTLAETKSATQRARALRFVESRPCPTCGGAGLRPDAQQVTWQGHGIVGLSALPVTEVDRLARARLAVLPDADAPAGDATSPDVPPPAAPTAQEAAERALLTDLVARTAVLLELGLGHLSLDRRSPTLSPGEMQRLRLGTLLHTGLFGVVYVLDEPSAGLHPRDAEALLRVLRRLVEDGNTVLVVEHDMAVVAACDHVVDVGPGAGQDGGLVLHSGPVDELPGVSASLTGRYLERPVHPEEVRESGPRAATGWLRVHGIHRHTVAGADVDLPMGAVTVVTGVSGSGKSSLLDGIAEAVRAHAEEVATEADDADAPADDAPATPGTPGESSLVGVVSAIGPRESTTQHTGGTVGGATPGVDDGDPAEVPGRLVRITQKPIGRSPRSTLATYTGAFDRVRSLFAATPEAKECGFGAGRFSFNTAPGRCPTCEGQGSVSVELLFMPGTYSICPDCHGARYDDETLEVRWNGLTIAEVLDLTVDEARTVFADEAPVRRTVEALATLGLGYLRLGHPATELSGGEAQRIKLATELRTRRRQPTLYLFDEPTTGLHPADTHRLLRQLHTLADAGHTVVLAEHDPVALGTADHLVEMGPGAGSEGGRVIASSPAG
ncbi:excinuclease ABC subunit UvrA [Kytococcus schroeteri]|uniref:excinuclease ABC subunit UvrA n=1 Tax=Kytococcus schroeteri TaxID=138300 RepID=UPI001144F3CA|nr:excinuclease ABC subunit UvrA [Kytococcus schroeteri]